MISDAVMTEVREHKSPRMKILRVCYSNCKFEQAFWRIDRFLKAVKHFPGRLGQVHQQQQTQCNPASIKWGG